MPIATVATTLAKEGAGEGVLSCQGNVFDAAEVGACDDSRCRCQVRPPLSRSKYPRSRHWTSLGQSNAMFWYGIVEEDKISTILLREQIKASAKSYHVVGCQPYLILLANQTFGDCSANQIALALMGLSTLHQLKILICK